MDSIDNKIKALLSGQIAEDESKEFLNIDFTLVQQNYELSMFVFHIFLHIFHVFLCLFIYVKFL